MIHHAHFEIGKYVRLTLKDGSTEEGRIVDIYDVRGDEFVTLVRQGSLFHNPVAIDKVQAVEDITVRRTFERVVERNGDALTRLAKEDEHG